MAKGRMINNKITSDKRINDLSDDTSRLAFTWLITFADVEGRTHGDPAMVRSMLFPRREDVTGETMTGYIKEWAASGLIVWYEAAGDWWIQFCGFDKNQSLRKDKEPASQIPAPDEFDPDELLPNGGQLTEEVRIIDGVSTEKVGVNLINKKRKEVNAEKKAVPKRKYTASPDDLLYYQLQDHFLEFTGLPEPKPKTQGDYREFNTLWKSPGKSILEWVNGDINKATILIEEAVNQMSKDRLTIANFKSIVKVASDCYRSRNNGHA